MPPHVHPPNTALRDPSSLFYQKESNRRLIIAAYWVVLIAALPIWWKTTSIERLSLPSSRVNSQAAKQLRLPIEIALEDVSLVKHLQQELDQRREQSPLVWNGLDVTVQSKTENGSYTIVHDDNRVVASERRLTFPLRKTTVPALADTLTGLLVPRLNSHRVAHYAPRYRLAFTLLNEDAAAGDTINGWDISKAISDHLSPIFDALSVLHNFTVESQVQFHAPLAFSPRTLSEGVGLTPEDLTVFVNSAEWTLSSSVSNDPVLHFLVFVPSATRRPMYILNSQGEPTSANSFLLPQWGGIIIYNPPAEDTLQSPMRPLPPTALNTIFSKFGKQLLALLGVARLPAGVDNSHTGILTGWQLDALLRRRAFENAAEAAETLQSIVKLVNQIENMPVGQDVRGDVQDSLDALDRIYASPIKSLNATLQHSANALTLASRAFFNPGMLALLYFPTEHKFAVYMPLFASAVIPLLATAVREIAAWRRQRREAP
ncbi:GPI transamidase component PIG-S [Mycena indigotica]|uniref:GPI transamidase component PIG-S n=1 Tax=Mycena indigotica TaxID=2126181 RepID=A0A8H6WG26_9AGAR|nr:GPI transamidase component PIG-S [Mycena indigotica]KAF7316382.1 GPI transamidase component PIG-S [Mycena indigotica]